MSGKIPVGVLGATGMVGQRFITLLASHPWFEVVCVAASPRSAGKSYKDAVSGKWLLDAKIPEKIKPIKVLAVERDMEKIAKGVSLVFSALDMDHDAIKRLENGYASLGVVVVSNNSAHRWTKDVPMILPEINPEHLELISVQKKNHGWKRGLVVVKPNCSIQSYVPLITPLMKFTPTYISVTTFQAVSGAGKTLKTWPEMLDNVIPYIGGEEKKSEDEPSKIWGKIKNGKIENVKKPVISATCVRVPVNDGHLAVVGVKFAKKVSEAAILNEWKKFKSPLEKLNLPSAPKKFITVFQEDNRPQTSLDRDIESGMGISVGRLRKDSVLDYKFVGLSHNTIRGAAGGAILTAELLKAKGFIYGKN